MWWWLHQVLQYILWEMKNIIATFLANLNDWEDLAFKHMDL